ncbi:MAG TPA: DHA2 family efflux MFS transporter permease subunit [Stellaceae bacterium]|nr:DHA2 family efflux MFS transporter permease subunit [Stellaceae bacterium]
MALFSLLTATALQALDLTIATIALPAMTRSLEVDAQSSPWILTTYIVATALATPTAGALSAAVGRRSALLMAVGGLTLASLVCAAAPNLPILLGARLAQGAAAGLIMPLVQATLLDLVPRSSHGRAMSFFGAAVMVGPILGPSIGGVLVDAFGWRTIFLINLPFGVLALLGLGAGLDRVSRQEKLGIDATGLVVFGSGIVALQLLLERGPILGWLSSAKVWLYALVMSLGIVGAVLRAARRRDAFPSLQPFADRNFSVTTACSFLAGFVVISSIALVPMMLENAFGYDAASAGLAMTPRGLGTMAMMLAMNRIVGRVDHRALLWVGVSLSALALLGLAFAAPAWGFAAIAGLTLVQGLGVGLIFTPLSTAAFSFLPVAMRTDATGIFALLRHLGGGIGVAVVSTFAFGQSMGSGRLLDAYRVDFLLLVMVTAVMAAAVALIKTDRPTQETELREAAD